jgi:hypothetical protein
MECHGPGAKGSDKGPLFVHRIYELNHHADVAFVLAVQRGVKAHMHSLERLRSLSSIDPLTGLLNRRGFVAATKSISAWPNGPSGRFF